MKELIPIYIMFILQIDPTLVKLLYGDDSFDSTTLKGHLKMTSPGGGCVIENGDKKWQRGEGIIQYSDITHSVFYTDHLSYFFIFTNHNSYYLPCHLF